MSIVCAGPREQVHAVRLLRQFLPPRAQIACTAQRRNGAVQWALALRVGNWTLRGIFADPGLLVQSARREWRRYVHSQAFQQDRLDGTVDRALDQASDGQEGSEA